MDPDGADREADARPVPPRLLERPGGDSILFARTPRDRILMTTPALARAAALDAADPLRSYRDLFVGAQDPSIPAYLDGNSLGRPLRASLERMKAFIVEEWGGRLIRGWDEKWFELPIAIGDMLAATVLGAAAGQATIGDSTTVLLYKLARGALALRPGRTEIVVDRDNFPTDRYVLESVAHDLGLTLRWI